MQADDVQAQALTRAAGRRLAQAGDALFVAPQWVLVPTEAGLYLQDLVLGTRTHLDGVLAAQVVRGGVTPLLETLAQLEPALARFLPALVAGGAPRPFDRAALLRGSGYGLLFVELTAQCNEECAHCYAEAGPARTDALDQATVEAVLDDAAALGFETVQFTGGDPLLCAFLPAAVSRAQALGLAVEIYTNGLALQGSLWEALRPLGPSFAFSFYSHDPAVHDGITRTPGSQARTARAIERVLAAELPCRIGVIGLAANRDGIPATVAYLRELGVPADRIGVSFERSVGRGQVTEVVELDWDALEGREEGAAHGADTHGERGDPWAGKALVAADGTVYPCVFSRSHALGDVPRQRLREALGAGPRLPIPTDLDARAAGWEDRLTCWECRLRTALLEAGR